MKLPSSTHRKEQVLVLVESNEPIKGVGMPHCDERRTQGEGCDGSIKKVVMNVRGERGERGKHRHATLSDSRVASAERLSVTGTVSG